MWWASCRQGFQWFLQVPATRNGSKALSELSGCDRKGRRHGNRGDSPARRPRRGRGRVRVPGGSRPFSLATSNTSLSRAQNSGTSCSLEHKFQGCRAAQQAGVPCRAPRFREPFASPCVWGHSRPVPSFPSLTEDKYFSI